MTDECSRPPLPNQKMTRKKCCGWGLMEESAELLQSVTGRKDECVRFFFPKERSHLDKVTYWSNNFMMAMLAILSGEKFLEILFFEQTE